jgi:hypothetical protein
MVQSGDLETKASFHTLFIQDQKANSMAKNRHFAFHDPKKPLIQLA